MKIFRKILLSGVMAIVSLPLAAFPDARIVFESDSHDFGEFRADSIQETVFNFRNDGDEPLVLTRVFSDCGCTVPSYSSAKIAPGEGGEIKVKFNGKGRGAGEFRKTVRIRSNALNPREVFFVKGRIKRVYKK